MKHDCFEKTTPYRELIQKEREQDYLRGFIDSAVKVCHGLSKEAGWWNGTPIPDIPIPEINTKLLLVVTEIAEATEGIRKNLYDDKLPHRKMVEVELADALIRICDLAGAMGLDLGGAMVEKLVFNVSREDHKAEVRAQAGGKAF